MIVSAFAARLRSGKGCLPCCYSAADLPFKTTAPRCSYIAHADGPGIKLIKESLQATLGLRIWAVVVLIDDLPEDRLIRIGMREEGHRGAQLDRVDAAEDLLGAASAMRSEDLGTLDEPWPEDRMRKVSLRLSQIADRVRLCDGAAAEPSDLREDEPHPMTGLRPLRSSATARRYVPALS